MLHPINHTRKDYSIISSEKPFQARDRGRSKIREKIRWADHRAEGVWELSPENFASEERFFRKERDKIGKVKRENVAIESRKCGNRRDKI
jgi:hypothetical protein